MKQIGSPALASSGRTLSAQAQNCGRTAQTVEETVEDHRPRISKPLVFRPLSLEARVGIGLSPIISISAIWTERESERGKLRHDYRSKSGWWWIRLSRSFQTSGGEFVLIWGQMPLKSLERKELSRPSPVLPREPFFRSMVESRSIGIGRLVSGSTETTTIELPSVLDVPWIQPRHSGFTSCEIRRELITSATPMT